MPPDLTISAHWIQSFMLAFARVGSVFFFVPIPGIRTGPGFARLLVSISVTLALFNKWPDASLIPGGSGELLLWAVSELVIGVTVGLFVSFLTELFSFAAQAVSLPAGYTYATTIDPGTQAESNILVSLSQLVSGLLFFSFDLHHQVIAALALSFDRFAPGQFALSPALAEWLVRAGAAMLNLGLGLVVPLLGFLLMIDVALALLGRLSTQVQVLTVSFPAKMLASLGVLAALGSAMPRLFEKAASQMLGFVWKLVLA